MQEFLIKGEFWVSSYNKFEFTTTKKTMKTEKPILGEKRTHDQITTNPERE